MRHRYASLFFVCGITNTDNELITLEIIHRYVEVLDRYFGNVGSILQVMANMLTHFLQVCELDLIFNFQKVGRQWLAVTLLNKQAYYVLDELIIAGELQESSKKSVLRVIGQQDAIEDQEATEESLGTRLGSRLG